MTETIFTPSATDPDVVLAAGRVVIVAAVPALMADPEVGPMYRVRNVDNGHETDAFADELTTQEA
jgi:hypothetical protein